MNRHERQASTMNIPDDATRDRSIETLYEGFLQVINKHLPADGGAVMEASVRILAGAYAGCPAEHRKDTAAKVHSKLEDYFDAIDFGILEPRQQC